ncbi:hypothetical protein [Nocardioides aequoreus]|uniref:hypothetical protein n=1 Tax=Nocardioides aequoreus TaxID=397278 RepID=UPI0004C39CD7|nr:hypothetical protein [Nocardioides aequoreus]
MVTIANLLEWKPEKLGEIADALVSRRRQLVDLQDEIDGGKPPATWVAGSAGGAHRAHDELRSRLNDIAAEVSDVAVNLDDVQVRIVSAKSRLRTALDLAASRGLTVNHASGQVDDPASYDDPLEVRAAENSIAEVVADIDAALDEAQQADLDLAAALQSAIDSKTEGGDGSLADAVTQTPESMDDLTPEQLAELLGDDVAIHTISAYLEAELELATWELEGKAQADYAVMADGTVKMKLALEAGLGREISVGGAEADVGAGATTELELKFDSVEEAQAFLDGLDDAAFDLGWRDATNAPAAVATNVAEYVMDQDISSFRTGVYASGEVEFDAPWARGAIEGRAEAYYDWAEEKYGVKLEATAEADLGRTAPGQQETGYGAAAGLSGELQITRDGDFDSLTLRGEMSASAANANLGITAPPGSSSAMGVDVQIKVDADNPALEDIKAAIGEGDFDRAKDLALDNGELVVRQTVSERISSGEVDVDAGPIGGVEVEYGADAETATQVWYREPGRNEVYQIDAAQLPVNQGG